MFYNAHLLPFFNSKCTLGILMWYCSVIFSWWSVWSLQLIYKSKYSQYPPTQERILQPRMQSEFQHTDIWSSRVLICSRVTNNYFWLNPSSDHLSYLLQRESGFMFIYLCTSNRWHSGIQYQQPVRHPRRTTSETLALLAYLSDTAKMHMLAAMQKHLKKDKRFCLNGKNNCKSNWQTYPLFGLEKYTQCIPLHLETSIKITFWQTDFSS